MSKGKKRKALLNRAGHRAQVEISDLKKTAREIDEWHAKAERCRSEALEYGIQAGRLLIAARAKVDHGNWEAWLADNVECSQRSAQKYMKYARKEDKLSNQIRSGAAIISQRDADKALAEPRPPAAASSRKRAAASRVAEPVGTAGHTETQVNAICKAYTAADDDAREAFLAWLHKTQGLSVSRTAPVAKDDHSELGHCGDSAGSDDEDEAETETEAEAEDEADGEAEAEAETETEGEDDDNFSVEKRDDDDDAWLAARFGQEWLKPRKRGEA